MNYKNQNPNQNQNQNQNQNSQLMQNVQATNTKFGDENASELAQSMGEISKILATQSMEIGNLIKGQNASQMNQQPMNQNQYQYQNQSLNQNQNPNQNMQNSNMYQSELEQSQGQMNQSLVNQSMK